MLFFAKSFVTPSFFSSPELTQFADPEVAKKTLTFSSMVENPKNMLSRFQFRSGASKEKASSSPIISS